MAETGLKKNDFVEIDFTARTQDGEIFDSNIPENIKKINPQTNPEPAKPFTLVLGQGMFLKGVEDFLIGKPEKSAEYKIDLAPENAFGFRDSKLIQRIPMKVFIEHKINPMPGVMFNFDGKMAKILTVSGGRVMVDFNNPLAGKAVSYEIKLLRKLGDLNEKVKILNEFLFRQEFKFEIKEKKLILEVDSQMSKFAELFKDKFKEILSLDLVVQEIKAIKKPKDEKILEKTKDSSTSQ